MHVEDSTSCSLQWPILRFGDAEAPIVQSVVTPLFDCADRLEQWLCNLDEKLSQPTELILVVDFSIDGTLTVAKSVLTSHLSVAKNIKSAALYVSDIPLFETACDNIGFKLSRGNFVIEIQSDIYVRTQGFDGIMSSVLSTDSTVFCVSGRAGHTLGDVYKNTPFYRRRFLKENRIGLISSLIENGEFVTEERAYYRCETVCRGPICYRRSDLIRLNFLDAENFFLGNDDHDLNLRAYLTTGRTPAYIPIRIYSPLDLGATRKERSGLNREYYSRLSEEKQISKSTLGRFGQFYRPYQKIEKVTF